MKSTYENHQKIYGKELSLTQQIREFRRIGEFLEEQLNKKINESAEKYGEILEREMKIGGLEKHNKELDWRMRDAWKAEHTHVDFMWEIVGMAEVQLKQVRIKSEKWLVNKLIGLNQVRNLENNHFTEKINSNSKLLQKEREEVLKQKLQNKQLEEERIKAEINFNNLMKEKDLEKKQLTEEIIDESKRLETITEKFDIEKKESGCFTRWFNKELRRTRKN